MKLRKVLQRYDRRQKAWVELCANAERRKAGSSKGYRRPGSRNPKRVGGK